MKDCEVNLEDVSCRWNNFSPRGIFSAGSRRDLGQGGNRDFPTNKATHLHSTDLRLENNLWIHSTAGFGVRFSKTTTLKFQKFQRNLSCNIPLAGPPKRVHPQQKLDFLQKNSNCLLNPSPSSQKYIMNSDASKVQ